MKRTNRYTSERKEAVLKKVLTDQNRSTREIAQEEGLAESTVYRWMQEAREAGGFPAEEETGARDWSGKERLMAVVESAALTEMELGEYCRRRGVYPEQLRAWRLACERATEGDMNREAIRDERQKNRMLERELARKEKALAETAALLVLRKKAQAIWGESEDA